LQKILICNVSRTDNASKVFQMPGAGQVKPCYNAEPQQNATEELIRKFIDSAENKRQTSLLEEINRNLTPVLRVA